MNQRKGAVMKVYRQGDVCLILVAELPKGAELAQVDGDVILAHGEVTGHAHRIKDSAKTRVYDAGAERFIEVMEAVALTHEEHGTVLLQRGVYRQAFQVDDFGTEVRRVAD